MTIRRKSIVAALAMAWAVTAGAADELNLYSARHYQTDEALYANFTKQTGIKINRIEGKEDELLERIKNEGANSPADVFITVDAARLAQADALGLFAPVKSKFLEERIPAHLREADIVVASTASPNVIITREMAAQALRARKRRPMFMVDIAVPRDIAPEVAELEDVYLFTVDDLQSVVNENMENRRQAARQAETMISAEVERFEHELRTRSAAPVIRRLRDEADHVRQHTLEQAKRMLASGRRTDEVLEFLSNTLTNRLLHAPSQRLRDAAETGDEEIVRMISDIYRLDRD